jgi:hypothetical protein
MTDEIDFDALSRKAIESNGAIKDLDHLYEHVFALQQWHFIARSQLPDVRPYVASNAQVAGGQYMVRAFTDMDRLLLFARENNLMEKDAAGEEKVSILSMPTDTIVDYLEQFIPPGVHGVWFNSDTKSDGFFVPLKQLRPIQKHLKSLKGNMGQ